MLLKLLIAALDWVPHQSCLTFIWSEITKVTDHLARISYFFVLLNEHMKANRLKKHTMKIIKMKITTKESMTEHTNVPLFTKLQQIYSTLRKKKSKKSSVETVIW